MKYIYVSIFLLAAVLVFAQPIVADFHKVTLVRVVDGDTIKFNLACKHKLFCRNMSVRVRGVDCPEMRSANKEDKERALAAKQFTQQFLTGRKIALKSCQKGKYFRMVCDVYADGKNLATALLEAGHAVPYK